MTQRKNRKREYKIDLAKALELWNAGKSVTQVAAHFSCKRRAAQYAIDRAELLGLGTARRGLVIKPEEQPPLWALFYGERT